MATIKINKLIGGSINIITGGGSSGYEIQINAKNWINDSLKWEEITENTRLFTILLSDSQEIKVTYNNFSEDETSIFSNVIGLKLNGFCAEATINGTKYTAFDGYNTNYIDITDNTTISVRP